MNTESENRNLEVMRTSDAEAAADPLGEIHAKLDAILIDLHDLRGQIAALKP